MNIRNIIAGTLLGLAVTTACAHPNVVPSRPNKQFYVQDLESRVHSLPEAIQQDIEAGTLKIVLQEMPKGNEHLNASYNEDTNTISIECNPEYTSCLTDALPHEVGHYIYKGISSEQRISAALSIQRRLHQPDAAAFQREIKTIDQNRRELKSLYTQFVIPKLECDLFLYDQALHKIFLNYAKNENVDSSGVEAAFNNYRELYPSCTTENRDKASSILSKVIAQMKRIETQSDQIYFQKKWIEPQEQEQNMDYTQDFPLHVEEKDKFKTAQNNFIDVFGNAKSTLSVERAYVHLFNVTNDRHNMVTELVHSEENIFLSTLPRGHDSDLEEQFAAGIASLFDLYKGPVVTAPMKYSLSDDILKTFAGIDYKRANILVPYVQRYRESKK